MPAQVKQRAGEFNGLAKSARARVPLQHASALTQGNRRTQAGGSRANDDGIAHRLKRGRKVNQPAKRDALAELGILLPGKLEIGKALQ